MEGEYFGVSENALEFYEIKMITTSGNLCGERTFFCGDGSCGGSLGLGIVLSTPIVLTSRSII